MLESAADNRPSRHVLIEFAGMPKSGKTTIVESVSHFLRRNRVPVSEYHGGGRYAPIGKDQIGRLNLYLAAEALRYVLGTTQVGLAPRVHLLDRGLVDRLIFTESLHKLGKIGDAHARAVTDLFTVPETAHLTDVCNIFVTSPRLSLQRERQGKLVDQVGRVMNTGMLALLQETATATARMTTASLADVTVLVDTAMSDGQTVETAMTVLDKIIPVLTESGVALVHPRERGR